MHRKEAADIPGPHDEGTAVEEPLSWEQSEAVEEESL